MVNLYNLEWELLKKSKIADRSPKSNIDTPSSYIYRDAKTNKYNKS